MKRCYYKSEDVAPEDQLMHVLVNKLSDQKFWEDVNSQFQAGKETAFVTINGLANDPIAGAIMATGITIIVTKAGACIFAKEPTSIQAGVIASSAMVYLAWTENNINNVANFFMNNAATGCAIGVFKTY